MARAKRKQPRRGWRRFFSWKWILLGLLGFFLLGVAAFAVAYAKTDVPQPNQLANAQASIVYYSDGKTEMDRISEVNRESILLTKIPLHVQRALLAAEDRTFYQNNGVSPSGIARAVVVAIQGGPTQGGSTITQQYVKNYFLTQDQTISRKAREVFIAVKIDQQQSKDQILENYLNTIYFGRGAYGIQTASRAYFGKDVSRLTVPEGALLASVIRAPSLYDPGLGTEQRTNAEARWNYVLDGMVSEGWLSAQDRAAATFPEVRKYTPRRSGGTTGYLTELVKTELRDTVGLSDTDIDRGGLRIVTTIDRKRQAAAVEAVKDRMPEGEKDLNVGLASITPGDGAVVALYGGADYATNQFNTATDASMQAGSTFKVFSLIGALQSGDLSIRNNFSGRSPQFFEQFADSGGASAAERAGRVENFGNSSYGVLDVRRATANSVNTIYARINIVGTPKRTVAAAQAAGVTTKLTANYANVFGTDNVKVLDMANAYATLAAGGRKARPYFVRTVTSADGAFDYTVDKKVTRVLDADLVRDVTYCLEAVVERGSGSYAGNNLGRPAAGKTGTTSDNYAAWFDGYVPQLATAVGMYKGDGSLTPENRMDDVGGIEVTGGSYPVRIWTDYMEVALEGVDERDFPQPAYVNAGARPRGTAPVAPTRPQTSRPTPRPPTSTEPAPTPTAEPTPTATAPPTPTRTPPAPSGRPPTPPGQTATPNRATSSPSG
ncbi:MAG TPA: transglycosylase domain-containing protein [Dermatophilaceae bacterium]|nr:transglycosylase domain-containing protein [Dermatophilaceae bacterium]